MRRLLRYKRRRLLRYKMSTVISVHRGVQLYPVQRESHPSEEEEVVEEVN
jgi:hypothetical protein